MDNNNTTQYSSKRVPAGYDVTCSGTTARIQPLQGRGWVILPMGEDGPDYMQPSDCYPTKRDAIAAFVGSQ